MGGPSHAFGSTFSGGASGSGGGLGEASASAGGKRDAEAAGGEPPARHPRAAVS